MLALGRFWSAWPLHPLTNRSSSCHRMAGACSAKVLIATADRRVISRPRVRQSAAPSRHERPPTQTRPFASVPALVAAVFGPAVGSAALMSVAVNGADLQLHWQYVRRSRVHGNQRSCTCGMLAAQVLVATADRRVVSRPRVRQSAAPSRHQLLPARGARGACKWRVSAGRRCSDVAHSSPASASSVFDLEPRLRSSVSSTKRDSRARVAGGDGLRATCSCAGRYRSQLAPGARSIPVGMAAASAHQPQL